MTSVFYCSKFLKLETLTLLFSLTLYSLCVMSSLFLSVSACEIQILLMPPHGAVVAAELW